MNLSLAGFLLLLLTAVFGALANLLIKKGIVQTGGGFTPSLWALLQLLRQPALVAGLLLIGIAGLLWFRVLATQKLSTCYPLFVSLTYTLITIGAFYFLHERSRFKSWSDWWSSSSGSRRLRGDRHAGIATLG